MSGYGKWRRVSNDGRKRLVGVFGAAVLALGGLACSAPGASSQSEAVAEAADDGPTGLVADPGSLSLAGAGSHAGCRSALSELVAVDLVGGDQAWVAEIRNQFGRRPAVVGGDLVVVDAYVGDQLPSLAAIEATSGSVRWQRFFEADGVRLDGVAPDGGDPMVAVSLWSSEDEGEGETAGVLVGPDGAEVGDYEPFEFDQWPESVPAPVAWRSIVPFEVRSDSPPTWRDGVERHKVAHDLAASTPAGGRQLITNMSGTVTIVELDGESTSMVSITGLDGDQEVGELGRGSSTGPYLHLGSDEFAIIGQGESETRLVVGRADTGEVLWAGDGYRWATMAGDNLIHDRISGEPDYAASVVREMSLIDAADPGDVHWTVPVLVNDVGDNGYLGHRDSPDGSPQLVFWADTDDGGEPDFVFLPNGPADPGELPDQITATVGSVRPAALSHVAADLVALVDGSTLTWQRAGEQTQRLDLPEVGELGPMTLTIIGDTAIIETPTGNGCEG